MHQLFTVNPDIYVPTRRKELWYYDINWSRGQHWYESFFPVATDCPAIGEVTPGYVFGPNVPARVHTTLGRDVRLIVMVRHPASQAWSWWQHNLASGQAPASFDTWLDQKRIYELSTGSHLERWLGYFERPCLHILVFEDFLAEPLPHLTELARFLGVPDRWPGADKLLTERINRAPAPSAFGNFARRMASHARQRGMDSLVNGVKRIWWQRTAEGKRMPPEVRSRLHEIFLPDMARTEAVLGRRIGAWK